MKVTKYAGRGKVRYTIDLPETEYQLLVEALDHGISILNNSDRFKGLAVTEKKILRSQRWSAITGPLTTIDEVRA